MDAVASISNARRHRQPGVHPVVEMRRQARAALSADLLRQIEPLLDDAERYPPDSGTCLHFIGKIHHKLNNPQLALRTYQDALNAGMRSAALFNDMGNVLAAMKQLPAAELAYGVALKLRPDLVPLYGSLGNVLLAQGKRVETIAIYEQCAAQNPDSALARHMLAALRGFGGAERAPDDYVRETFDAFSASFDEKLASLRYSAPEIVAGAIARRLGDARDLNILDIGCGTGLCGAHMKPRASRLVGIDLSAKMIEKASERALYDELIVGELTATLPGFDNAFDVIVAADVLVYFGALETLLSGVYGAGRGGALFVFTVEAEMQEGVDYTLGTAGRYAHGSEYLHRVAKVVGFDVTSFDKCVLRYEYGEPVIGFVMSLTKTV